MAQRETSNHPAHGQDLGVRALIRAGCGPEELRLLLDHYGQGRSSDGDLTERLTAISEFARALGASAARDYFRALRETKAVEELTDPRLLAFARSIDRHTAEWYFWAIWGTRAVRELTSENVLRAVKFFRAINSPATVEYFLAVRETGSVAALTDERVLAFAQAVGSDAAVEFFGACWETKSVAELTSERVLTSATALGGDATQEYFRAVREAGEVEVLTGAHVLSFATSLGGRLAQEYFRAIRETRAVKELTDDSVLLFTELIGRSAARQYFRVLASTKAVGALTAPSLLRASGVIRSIGADAALDYFLARAAGKFPTDPAESEGAVASPSSAVPVLTLLDLPSYERYRSAGMVGATAAFWWGIWQSTHLPVGAPGGLVALGLAAAAWAVLLGGVYVLLSALARHSGEEFLRQRRRLLNEHGIRWHDCTQTQARCPLCWTEQRSHADARFDNGRFCRCPAC